MLSPWPSVSTDNTQYKVSNPCGPLRFRHFTVPEVSPLDSDQGASPLDSEQALSPCTRPKGRCPLDTRQGPCPCTLRRRCRPTPGPRALPFGFLPLHPASALPPDARPTGAALWIPGKALPLHPAQALPPCTRGSERSRAFLVSTTPCFFMAFVINFDEKRRFLVRPSVTVSSRSFRSVSFYGGNRRFW